ncbi:MAG: 50S ribosomal protein L17 [Ignavibacteriae bacterium]|nr:50S ribosomal protein L17 [Ignavibacteriota bacterium]
MEHRKKGRKLKRTASHKKALMANLAVALIKHKRIKTTVAKAKELRTYIEPYVTKAKNALNLKSAEAAKGLHLRRVVASMIKDKEAVRILFDEIAKKVESRNGGYTRILKTGFRYGDGASEAIIEFVDYSIFKEKEKAAKKKEEVKDKGKEKTEVKEEDKTEETKKDTKKKTVAKPKAKKTPAKEKEAKPKSTTTKAKKVTKQTKTKKGE